MVRFRILALGGGGTKGFLHIGALHEIEFRVGLLSDHFYRGVYGCSIGAVIATGIAFGMSVIQMERISKRCMSMSFLFDNLSLDSLTQSGRKKGFVSMDSFEKHLLDAFDSEGVDLRNKYLCDGKIPLCILASNMTRNVPTLFKDKVPILAALKASCCIPNLFRPQIIGKSVYLDGGTITNDFYSLLPKEDKADTLSMNLIHANPHITPDTLESLTPLEFMYKLYKTSCLYHTLRYQHPNILHLYYASGSGFVDKSETEKDEMIVAGRCLMRNFLSKRSC